MLPSTRKVLLLVVVCVGLSRTQTQTGVSLTIRDFASTDCSGTPTRSLNIAHQFTSAWTGCIVPGGGFSISGEYCDMSVSPPLLRGTYYTSTDCSTMPNPYASVADGSTCSVTSPTTSSKFRCFAAASEGFNSSCGAWEHGPPGSGRCYHRSTATYMFDECRALCQRHVAAGPPESLYVELVFVVQHIHASCSTPASLIVLSNPSLRADSLASGGDLVCAESKAEDAFLTSIGFGDGLDYIQDPSGVEPSGGWKCASGATPAQIDWFAGV